jgi:TolB-like protein
VRLLEELRRRNVFRVGAAYVVLGWVVVQVTETVSPALKLPEWTLALVIWIGIIAFPFVLFFAWAYEITPEGIKRESEVERPESITHVTGRKLDAALLVLVVVAIVLIAWDLMTDTPATDAPMVNAAAEIGNSNADGLASDSIVVLPLLNMSAVASNEYFAGGVHEEITTNLSQVENLRVVSRTTALRYLASGLSLGEIGHELGVRYIVDGSVRRIDNHVRITVRLIDAADDTHLWARNYDRELVDVFATQSEVAREISNSIQLEILPESVGALRDMPTTSVKAYDLYIKAASIDRSERISEQNFQRQRELLEEAVGEDPDFVEAWARLNIVLDEITREIIQRNWFGESAAERDANLEQTRRAALRARDRAVALDPDNVMTLIAQAEDFVAELEDVDYQVGRRKYLDRALELDPENAFAWYVYGWWYINNGRADLAEQPFLKALELDPFHAHIVTGSYFYFSNVAADEDMTAMLSDRLVQIGPDLKEHENLAKTSSRSRLESILRLFLETGDTSIIDTYAEAYAHEAENFVSAFGIDVPLIVEERLVRVLENDLEGLAEMAIDGLSGDPTSIEARHLMIANTIVLSAQRTIGQHEDAAETARLILNTADQLDFSLPEFFLPVIAAQATLGNDGDVQERRQVFSAPDSLNRLLDAGDPFVYVALAILDANRAVELLLDRKIEHPDWLGTDVLAMNHTVSRQLITHPDMQAFYVDEGKWIDYLAARVPEYESYRPGH